MAKKKRSALEILRDRERRRRLVPPVVLRRRRLMSRGVDNVDDIGMAVLGKAERYSKKHAKSLHDMILRSIGLTQAPGVIKERFSSYGLDGISLDSNAEALIGNAIRKVNEILLFKLVATELINDAALREKLIELFINQRFEVMLRPQKEAVAKEPSRDDPHTRERDNLVSLLQKLMDT